MIQALTTRSGVFDCVGREFAKLRSGLSILTLMGAVVFGLAVWAAIQEANPYLSSSVSDDVAGLLDGSFRPGLSSASFDAYADVCMRVVPRLQSRLLTGDAATRLTEACVDTVERVANATPVNGAAWFALAYDAAYRGDRDRLNHGLQMSWASSGNEYWLAARRVELGETKFALLDPATIVGHNKDLANIAGSTVGSRWLARRYVIDADFRDRITGVVEQMSPAEQGEFLSNVQLAAGGKAVP